MTDQKNKSFMSIMLRSLSYAITEGDEATVASLIESGVDVNGQVLPDHGYGNVPVVMLAAASGYPSICALIIDAGADPNVKDWKGESALHCAAASGHLDACRLLIAAGANVDAVDRAGNTPIFSAIRHGETAVFNLLIDSGATATVRNSIDVSPLHFAARYGHEEMCRILLDRGADCQLRARAYSPRANESWGDHPTGNLTPLHAAIDADSVEICRMLVERGADANYLPRSNVARDYLTPLQMAVNLRRYPIVHYFLFECDLDFDSTPVIFGGKTLMQVADGSSRILEWLNAARSERAVTKTLVGVVDEDDGAKRALGGASMGML